MSKRAPLFGSEAEETPVVRPIVEPNRAKRGKHLISGMYEEPVYRQFTTLAAELGMKRQDLVREALNDVFIKYGKPPIA